MDRGRFLAHEVGDLGLDLDVQVAGSGVRSRRAEGDAVFFDTLLGRVCALALGLGESEVIVRSEIQELARLLSTTIFSTKKNYNIIKY